MPRLKRWESPRREGRNDKGKGGYAKKKQWQKRLKMLKNKLKSNQEGEVKSSPFFIYTKEQIVYYAYYANSQLSTTNLNSEKLT
ncbi:hypothetical protein GM3708_2397 [Geminocystis sp. NIES-3708]|uniref:hypothetical protein n=1 Tax=Geminocystis sp. NIES-3708 TaxID=1615909 RepID=UPI0005FC7F09|nr:hypothetical protein [Geminocystis sp. NIES-3708]BAQ61991.1 hypothetical protein GM3708_2397 [Geminocystis sp. NIES-3708]